MADLGLLSGGELMGELARHNINIMAVTDDYIFIEFQFRQADGRPKWARSVYKRRSDFLARDLNELIEVVRDARARAEAYEQRG